MAEQTMLNEAKTEVMDALEEHLGAKEVNPRYVTEYHNYGSVLERMLDSRLATYAEYKYFHSTEREELLRQQKAQREAELKERSKAIRDNIMIGVLSNMTMKLRKHFPDAIIEFIVDTNGGSVNVYGDESTFGETPFISVDYGKNVELGIYRLTTKISFLEDNTTFHDDGEVINGNKAPRSQFKGIAALDDYLDTLTEEGN